jgi:hypothetical protein
MGLRVVLFTVAFNLLLWVSRLTLGARLIAARGPTLGWALTLLAPTALLLLAARLHPARRDALVTTATASLALASCVSP